MEWTSDNIEAAMTASAEALGYDKLTSNQSKVLRSFLSGSDVFASLPTGSGKLLCYWILPDVFNMLRKTYLYCSGCQPIDSSNEGSGGELES